MLETRYHLRNITSLRPLTGGYWNQVLRLESERGTFVLRLSHPSSTPDSVAYEHALMRFMRRHLPQVPEPLTARDGSTCFLCDGRVVSLFEWMPGEIADRERAAVRAEAARVLARLHQAALRYPDASPRPRYPPVRDLDWDRNRQWDWEAVRAFLCPRARGRGAAILDETEGEEAALRREIAARRLQIEQEREELRDWVARLAASGRPLLFAPTHGDYYRGSLLVEGDRITAVLDWDECQPEWLAWELARALWEFCKCKQSHTLQTVRVPTFLQAYREAGGPVTRTDFDLLVPFIRCVRLMEVLFALGEAVRGEPWDARYTLHNLLSLENLSVQDGIG